MNKAKIILDRDHVQSAIQAYVNSDDFFLPLSDELYLPVAQVKRVQGGGAEAVIALTSADVDSAVMRYVNEAAGVEATDVRRLRGGGVEVTVETSKNGLDLAKDMAGRKEVEHGKKA